ncbi:MAG TPA: IS1595 family transposase [Rhizomicrobium sp.]|jgi:transposase-like protein|nr:IS1595 family transposase [Rhizomicrobium sp.]
MNKPSPVFDIYQRDDLAFPKSLPQFQKLFPDDAACAAYLEQTRWEGGFSCPHCGVVAEPFRFANKPGVLRCRSCRRDTALTAGTVMERTRMPLSVWFWAAYLMSSHTAGMSALQFQRQLGIKRYETAFQIMHKLRAGMVRHDADQIGKPGSTEHVEVDEVWIGGPHHQTLVLAAVEVRQRQAKPDAKGKVRRGGRYAGRLRIQVIPDRQGETLCDFVEDAVLPGTMVITDGWRGYADLTNRGYDHLVAVENHDPQVTEDYLPISHLVFSNLKSWLLGCHHGVSPQHLQAYLNEYTFRFNRRFQPFNAFRSLLGIGSDMEAPTYHELYSGEWQHSTMTGGSGTVAGLEC